MYISLGSTASVTVALPGLQVRFRTKLGRQIVGFLEKGIQTPMAQGWSAKIISMIKWIRTSRLSMKNSLYAGPLPSEEGTIFAGG